MTKQIGFRPTEAEAKQIEAYMGVHKCTQTEAIHALLSEKNTTTQIERSVEVIIPKKTSEKIEQLKVMDELDERHHQRKMREIAASARPTPQAEKTIWGVGHIGIDTSFKVNSPSQGYIHVEEPKPERVTLSTAEWEQKIHGEGGEKEQSWIRAQILYAEKQLSRKLYNSAEEKQYWEHELVTLEAQKHG